MRDFTWVGTGNNGLDSAINHLRLGDNVVWQTDNIADYKKYVQMYAKKSLEDNRKLIYIRFADHEPLLEDSKEIITYKINAYQGFEDFSLKIHQIIEKEGVCAFYVFDCLSYLLDTWATDLMIGNFFYVTCPYLYKLDTVAYFAILRNHHSYHTIARIRETTQVLLDLYNIENEIYIHPLKVIGRYSSTMFLPHHISGEDMIPITSSTQTARLFSSQPIQTVDNARSNLDYWDKLFISALDLLEKDESESEVKKEKEDMLEKIIKLVIGKEDKILTLARKYFTLKDMVELGSRLIVSGFVGGKAVGMLLARKILESDKKTDWHSLLEPHDSYYIGSDVFYSYIVQNNLWELYLDHRKKENFLDKSEVLREKLKNGIFPNEVKEKFVRMLEYFGQSPIIVRSSSLLEDSFGNAFAGKYESFFCVNQGTPAERYRQFEQAVRNIYASTMSEDALTYRMKRKLDDSDEQMALLVQRVSGDYHGKYFFPTLAGVGYSHNMYAWKPEMDPKAGLIRLVFGLGTRAVNRAEGDYPRIMALDYPAVQPLSGKKDTKQYSQHSVDVLNTFGNNLHSIALNKLMWDKTGINMDLVGVIDHETNKRIKEYGIQEQEAWTLTYEKLIKNTSFIKTMQDMMSTLEAAYDYPVDIEFTINFAQDDTMHINLLQCRPLQTRGIRKSIDIPKNIPEQKILFKSSGNFMGGNIYQNIKRIIIIDSEGYANLAETDKYQAARIIGKINNLKENHEDMHTMLVGPGRWGTTTASLGIPVSFSEISNVSILCEREFKTGGMTPELSYGSHFFQDLVEENIFYTALFAEKDTSYFNEDIIKRHKNILTDLLPDEKKFEDVVKVIEPKNITIISNTVSDRVICFER